MANRPINALRAEVLYWRLQGDWHAVGAVLAKEEGRAIKYQAEALRRAVRKRLKQMKDGQCKTGT